MRFFRYVLVVLCCVALSGCVSDTYNRLSNLSTGCTTTAFQVACSQTTTTSNNHTPGQTVTTNPDGTTTTSPTVNTGNTNTMTTGDTTLILEGSTVKSVVGAKPGLSRLADSPLNHLTSNQTANTSIAFNTNTSTNSNWPTTKTMAYNEYGTCSYSGGVDPANPGKCVDGNGGTGLAADTLGGDYKLYRAYQQNVYDEELQIWTWGNSYATQYRDVTASGTDPQHQAWSFGGNYTPTTAMPALATRGDISYAGKWGATVKTSNWVDSTNAAQTMSWNNNWRVEGDSALKANFGTGAFSGTLTPVEWEGVTKDNGFDYILASDIGSANFNPFMQTKVYLAGTITTDATNTAKPNQITGTATLDPAMGWLTSNNINPVFGGVFGANAEEITGAFAVSGATTYPNGGYYPINNDRRAYISMSGIFHGAQ